MKTKILKFLLPLFIAIGIALWSGMTAASGMVRIKPTITHVLEGIESVPRAFEITANKGKYAAINPAQVVISRAAA